MVVRFSALFAIALLAVMPAGRAQDRSANAAPVVGSETEPAAPVAHAVMSVGPAPVLRRAADGALTASSSTVDQRFTERGAQVTTSGGALTVTLRDIRLGLRPLALGRTIRPVQDGPGRVNYARGAVVERYDLLDNGVEQSFVFNELASRETMTLRVALETTLTPVMTDGSVELRGTDGSAVLVYGAATAIDAAGRRQALRYELQAGLLVMTLDASFLAGAALPLVIDPPIITQTPTSLTFNMPLGGPNPFNQPFYVKNTGTGGQMSYTLSVSTVTGGSWLTVNPTKGKAKPGQQKKHNVSINGVALAAGTYLGTVTITAPGATNTPQTVAITLNVLANPTISLSPTTITFSAPTGGPNPTPQSVTLTNVGGGTLNWTASASTVTGGSWLAVTPTTGSLGPGASANLSLSIDVITTALAAGAYSGTITVTAPGATNSPQTVAVTLNVNGTPTIGVTPASLGFSAPSGGPNPSFQNITVTNTGGGTLNWTALAGTTSGGAWLSVTPASGSLSPGSSAVLAVSVDVISTSLASGGYDGSITISGNAANSPQTVAVLLDVEDFPAIVLTPSSLTFNGSVGGSNPTPQVVTVANAGSGTLNWSALATTLPAGWLLLSPAAGALGPGASQPMTASIDLTGLPAGTYTGTIDVSDPDPNVTNSPQTVFVTLNVLTPPTIALDPTSLTFDVPTGGPNPASQQVGVSNTGTGTVNWTASVAAGAPWLSLSPTSGSVTAVTSPQYFSASVDVTGLLAGTYTALIVVTDAGASNSPQLVSVTLNVNGLPKLSISPATLTYDAAVGGPNPPMQAITVANVGLGAITWNATSDATWLSSVPTTGPLATGGSTVVDVAVDVTGLAAGTYTGTLSISAAGATNSPQKVFVTLNVNTLPKIGVSAGTFTFNAPLGGPNPANQTLTITNTGAATLNWTAAKNPAATWLTIAPTVSAAGLTAGQTEDITLTVDVTALAAGSYSATITVTDAGASNSPQTVQVDLNVNGSPMIGLSPTSLSFDVPVFGGPNPLPQDVTISNQGAGTLNWTATIGPGAPWLSVLPVASAGGVAAGASETMTASVDITGLAPGTYTATITIADAGATNTPQTVFVLLQIAAPIPPPPPPRAQAGFCGALGVDLLIPVGLLWLLRRAARRRK